LKAIPALIAIEPILGLCPADGVVTISASGEEGLLGGEDDV
jgi:hypothetical protein